MSKDHNDRRPISWLSRSLQKFQDLGSSRTHLTISTGANHQARALLLSAPSHSRSEEINDQSSFNSVIRSSFLKPLPQLPTSTTTNGHPDTLSPILCSACGKAMEGPFVRALGSVFHLNCFRCMDCGEVVASKFFHNDGSNGKHNIFCERDYFRRLDLICNECGIALRGSYITACNKKYHVDHFSCSLCSTCFGPQDSYYEHDNDVYCHFHFSTRFAMRCEGCNSALLKQFVEINRNTGDVYWHPECYMIYKFWNVKVAPRRPTALEIEGSVRGAPIHIEEESQETPTSLQEKRARMEHQIYQIWTVLSAFEESSAACISDIVRQCSEGGYLNAITVAEKFILHVEVLFGSIDDLRFSFSSLNVEGINDEGKARTLCHKTVELFTLLSHTLETGAHVMDVTQELLALITGLAHYLKVLIRIALNEALKLEREHSVEDAIANFLDKFHQLAVQEANPSAKRLMASNGLHDELLHPIPHANMSTKGVKYGFRSLAPEYAGESPFSQAGTGSALSTNTPSDLCVRCGTTVEADCVRLGTYQRWHSHCIECTQCGKVAVLPIEEDQHRPRNPSARRPSANVDIFLYDTESMQDTLSFGEVPTIILCTAHAHQGCRSGFQPVQRLEQYAFLLNVALRRVYHLLKTQGIVHLSPDPNQPSDQNHDADDCPRFSVQSFEPQGKGLSGDIIVTVGMRDAEDPSGTLFTADPFTPSRFTRPSFQSTTSLTEADPNLDDRSDGISEYWSFYEMSSKGGSLHFRIGNESNRDLFSSGMDEENWDGQSVLSRQTFATAHEPPPELLLALGLHLDPTLSQTPLSSDKKPLTQPPVPGFRGVPTGGGQIDEEESVDSRNPITKSNAQYSTSFIRDVSNVSIIGSHINFTTSIIQPDDGVCVGLHTLFLRSDPTALHNSYERQKKINQQTKAVRAWGSQLLITSSSSLHEYPLSVPCIKTRDLEEVVKDTFTWLYSASSPHSIMWLYDEYEGNLRTSLISQCLADFLGERLDLTASYFYRKYSHDSQAGTSHSGADRKDNPSSIIPTIAYDITRRLPEIEIPIALTAAKHLEIFDMSLDEQMKKLIVDPLQAASNNRGDSRKFPQLFLIHGLEDCDDDDFQELFLRAFRKSLTLLQQCIPQKLIVLGRHSAHLGECFSKPEMQGIVRHRLLPVSQDVVV